MTGTHTFALMTAEELKRGFDTRSILPNSVPRRNVEDDAIDLYLKLEAAWLAWEAGHLRRAAKVQGGTAAAALGFSPHGRGPGP